MFDLQPLTTAESTAETHDFGREEAMALVDPRLRDGIDTPEDALRSELMPVNDRYPLADVLEACRAWHAARRRQVFVEYLMLGGVNDRYEQAVALRDLLQPRKAFKVNLIPYNPTDAAYEGSSREAVETFKNTLEERGVRTTIRLTRGRDIAAACGQLAAGENMITKV